MKPPDIEETQKRSLDFGKIDGIVGQGVVPVVVQDIESRQVLILAYANQQALEYTWEHKVAAFWSTSRNALWIKGEVSGVSLEVKEILINCEQNSLLYLVSLRGEGACHTKGPDGKFRLSCFYRRLKNIDELEFL